MKSWGVCTEVPNVDTKRGVGKIGVFLVRGGGKLQILSSVTSKYFISYGAGSRSEAKMVIDASILTPGSWWHDLLCRRHMIQPSVSIPVYSSI